MPIFKGTLGVFSFDLFQKTVAPFRQSGTRAKGTQENKPPRTPLVVRHRRVNCDSPVRNQKSRVTFITMTPCRSYHVESERVCSRGWGGWATRALLYRRIPSRRHIWRRLATTERTSRVRKSCRSFVCRRLRSSWPLWKTDQRQGVRTADLWHWVGTKCQRWRRKTWMWRHTATGNICF